MFGLKIFVRVQTFRRVPPVLPCNFCHPDCRYVLFLVQSFLLCLWNFIASRLSKKMTKAGNIQFLFKLHIYSNPFNLWIQFQRTVWASVFPKWHLSSNPIFLKIQIPVLFKSIFSESWCIIHHSVPRQIDAILLRHLVHHKWHIAEILDPNNLR